MRVLVTDPHTRTALAAVRSLSRTAEVHVAGSGRCTIAASSRHVTAAHPLPDPWADAKGYVDALASLARALDVDAILPVTDLASHLILPARERFGRAIVAGPSAEAFSILSDKARAMDLSTRFGIGIPPGRLARGESEAEAVALELGYPVILKPVASVSLDAAGSIRRGGVVRVERRQDLVATWRRAVGDGSALVQSVVPGWGEGLFLLRWGGTTLAVSAHRRLREKPPEGGLSTLRESIPVDVDELRRLEALLDEAGFDGVAMAEFRTDGRTRWLMEFNARLWGSLQLAIDAGVDFPRLLVEAALGRRPPAAQPGRIGVRSRWFLGDLDHALLIARGARSRSGESGIPAALRLIREGGGPECHSEVLRADDPRPFLLELCVWVKDLIAPVR